VDAGSSVTRSFVALQGQPVAIGAEADTYVRGGQYADQNFGTETILVTKNDSPDYARQSYLRFDLSALQGQGQVIGAQVQLVVTSTGQATVNAAAVVPDNSWDETALTWNTQPPADAAFATWTAQAGQTVTFSVTAQVQDALARGGKLSLLVFSPQNAGSGGWVDYGSSRGGAAVRPQLVVFLAAPQVLAPVATAYVRGGQYGDQNFGTSTILTTKNDSPDYERQSYLRFDLSAVQGQVIGAEVRLVVTSLGQPTLNAVAVVPDDTWDENGLTWNNQPSAGRAFATWTAQLGQVVTFPVTAEVLAALAGDGQLTLRLYSPRAVGGGGWVDYGSRHAGAAVQPELVLFLAPGPVTPAQDRLPGAASLLAAWPVPPAVWDRQTAADTSGSQTEGPGTLLPAPPAAEVPALKDDLPGPGLSEPRVVQENTAGAVDAVFADGLPGGV
jgi:hypothetical protein